MKNNKVFRWLAASFSITKTNNALGYKLDFPDFSTEKMFGLVVHMLGACCVAWFCLYGLAEIDIIKGIDSKKNQNLLDFAVYMGFFVLFLNHVIYSLLNRKVSEFDYDVLVRLCDYYGLEYPQKDINRHEILKMYSTFKGVKCSPMLAQ